MSWLCSPKIGSSVELRCRRQAGIAFSIGVDGCLCDFPIVTDAHSTIDISGQPHPYKVVRHGGQVGIGDLFSFFVGNDRMNSLVDQLALAGGLIVASLPLCPTVLT